MVGRQAATGMPEQWCHWQPLLPEEPWGLSLLGRASVSACLHDFVGQRVCINLQATGTQGRAGCRLQARHPQHTHSMHPPLPGAGHSGTSGQHLLHSTAQRGAHRGRGVVGRLSLLPKPLPALLVHVVAGHLAGTARHSRGHSRGGVRWNSSRGHIRACIGTQGSGCTHTC